MDQEDFIPPHDVAALLGQLHDAVRQRGFTLSRWQTNEQHYRVRVTYAVHRGSRPERSTLLRPEDLICSTWLSQKEGTTSKCEAYRGLSGLLKAVLEHPCQPRTE